MKLRNIAIIAHVDHGKTTLVDKMLLESDIFSRNEKPGDLIMDSNPLEKERGITILSKNVAVNYKDYKINILDTPGHADFGGEVERVLNMVDGVILLVDAIEGPMPQTRFVLSKALVMGLKPIVVINKVDKLNCNPEEINEMVFELMFNLDATEDQLDFSTVYGSSKNGWMGKDWRVPNSDITYLMDKILEDIPAPESRIGDTQMLITSLDYSSFIGRIAIGRLHRGTVKENQNVVLCKRDGSKLKVKIKEVFVYEGFEKIKVSEVHAGEICAITGIEGFEIGDTIADIENPEALPNINIDEPTMSMTFTINDSPFFGIDGKFVTSRQIKDRLEKEEEKNLALRVEQTEYSDKFKVFGRGILHLSILIETMRREGYELQIGQPQVIIKEIDGIKNEPIEELIIEVPEKFSGKAIEMVSIRKGEMTIMETKGELMHLEFNIPSRGIIGLRNHLLTSTSGEAIMSHRFKEFQPYRGDIPSRLNGSLISIDEGIAIPYSLSNMQERGIFFVEPNQKIYEGQIIGKNTRSEDLVINITKTKKMSNMRSSGSDDKVKIAPATILSLEESLEYIQSDEYVEVTPNNLRLRKILLKEHERKRSRLV
tara:strand:- start:2478 stop:4274 length:1797 start_codon:yes stop_codon:yes gene_type:complete